MYRGFKQFSYCKYSSSRIIRAGCGGAASGSGSAAAAQLSSPPPIRAQPATLSTSSQVNNPTCFGLFNLSMLQLINNLVCYMLLYQISDVAILNMVCSLRMKMELRST
jgi:hypothetical protein